MINASGYFSTMSRLRSSPAGCEPEHIKSIYVLAKRLYLEAVISKEPLVEQLLWARRVIHLGRNELFWVLPVYKSSTRFNSLTKQEKQELAACFDINISGHPLMRGD